MREFRRVEDVAYACIFLMDRDISKRLHNVDTATEVAIREFAETVMDVVGIPPEIAFDASRRDGTPRRLFDVSRMKALGWQARIGLRDEIRSTCASFLESPVSGGVSPRLTCPGKTA